MSEIGDYEVIRSLRRLRWRDLPYVSYTRAPFSFQHRQSQLIYPYIDGAGHAHTGKGPDQYSARLRFLNTLDGAGTFPDVYNEWMRELDKGGAGDLEHPLRGTVRARVMEVRVDLDSRSTAGVDVDIAWEQTLEDPEEAQALEPVRVNVREQSAKADRAIENAGIVYPSGESDASLSEMASRILGLGDQLAVELEIVRAKTLLLEIVDTITETFPAAHARAESTAELATLWAAYDDMGKRNKAKQRPTRGYETDADTSIPGIAARVGNTVEEITELNPQLLAEFVVRKGTAVLFYSDS